MPIDIHAHYISPRLLKELASGALPIGLDASGPAPRLRFPHGESRPFPPGVLDLDERRKAMNAQGVTQQVLSPWPELFGYSLPPDDGARWARLLNDTLAEALGGNPDFAGLGTVPLQDAERAGRELEYACGRLGLAGAMIGATVNGTDLDAEALAPFWSAAAALGKPLVIHPVLVDSPPRAKSVGLGPALGFPWDTTLAAARVILGGILERHPDLPLVLAHGGGYLPYQIGRLVRLRATHPDLQAKVPRDPLEYLRGLFFDSILHFPPALRYLVSVVGSDRVLLGTDYPFDMADPDPLGSLAAADLSVTDQQRIARENAKRLFKL